MAPRVTGLILIEIAIYIKKEIGILIKKEIAIYGVTGLILIENCNVSISILKGQIND